MTQQKRDELKAIMLFVMLFGTSLITMMTFTFGAEQTYTIGVQRGTDVFEVITYDETKWNATVGTAIQPNDLLGGEANNLGAKSKITIRSVDNVKWGTFDSLNILFNVLDSIPTEKLIPFTIAVGFNESNINGTYPSNNDVAVALASEWTYTTEIFEETPNDSFKLIPILKDPTNYSELLADYNTWVESTNANPTVIALSLNNFQNYTGEEFLMELIHNEFATAIPITEYLTAMVNDLNCTNVTVDVNSLIIQKVGIKNYTITVTYSDQGLLTSYVVKDLEGTIFYEIALNTFDDIVLLIVELSIVIGIAGIVILSIRKKKRTRKI